MSSSTQNIINAFCDQIDNGDISNDFKEFWRSIWKPITQKCLNVAKHKFIMRKAFELFKAHFSVCKFANINVSFSETFVEIEEIDILQSLCKHVGLQGEEFIYFGLLFHKNRCKKYFESKI
jgi:hypothetical protein|tara:strand:- start:94 stop:456 length:363 start_codon:yes stop_codon:yes gene_type:complete